MPIKIVMTNFLQIIFLSLFLNGLVFANTDTATENLANMDIIDMTMRTQDLSTLLTALRTADLEEMLQAKGPFTLFAPTNAAFEKIPKEELATLLSDKGKLKNVLKYHMVSGALTTQDIQNGAVRTLQGRMLDITKMNNSIMINNAKVVAPEIQTTNGVIHEIDTVLMPPVATLIPPTLNQASKKDK